MIEPQAEILGITLPDRTLPIDWDEFTAVLAGNGPCNAQRLQHRRTAHEDGAWVREAARAYAEKQRAAEVAA
jgi:ring-1,2-phenylacetyl-CoA epoxidase subunit PaaA